MNRDIFIRNLTRDTIEMSPRGRSANELTPEEFEKVYESFFDMIFGIAAADISSLSGYGEFDGNNTAPCGDGNRFPRSVSYTKRERLRFPLSNGTPNALHKRNTVFSS